MTYTEACNILKNKFGALDVEKLNDMNYLIIFKRQNIACNTRQDVIATAKMFCDRANKHLPIF